MNGPDFNDLCTPLTLEQASKVAHVSIRTLERWMAADKLAPIDMPKAARAGKAPWRYVDEAALLAAEREAWWARNHRKSAA